MRYTRRVRHLGNLLLPALVTSVLFAGVALADQTGQVYEHMAGDEMIEIGVDMTDILPGVPATLSFAMIEHPGQPGWKYAPSDDVRVTITDERGETVHEETLSGPRSPRYLSYAFPRSGVYEVAARFERDGESIGETSLTLVATRSLNIDILDWFVVFALAVGGYAGLLYGMSTKRP